MFCMTRDITDRKQAEERLREYEKVVEGLEEMIVVLDRDYRYLLANRAYLRYRASEREQLIGRTVQEVLGEQTFGMIATRLKDCLAGKSVKYEIRHDFPDLGERDLLVSYFPIDGPGGIDRVACVLQDITERNQAHEKLGMLSRRLFHVQEEERRHLARELHDEIGQVLTAAKINLNSIELDSASPHCARLEETVAILDKLLRQVRQISFDLHPSLLDDLGLVPALRSLLDQQAGRAGLRAQFSSREPLGEVDHGAQTTAFRIAQEAITNVLRHAKARFIALHLWTEGSQLRMRIIDDGIGFRPGGASIPAVGRDTAFGLVSMKERAGLAGGSLRVISAPNKGTTVDVLLPLRSRPGK